MTAPIVTFAYRSRASDGIVDQRTLNDILAVCQNRNIETGITGALAYGDGHFVQVLEGPEVALLATMRRIATDPRHGGIESVGPTPIERRNFPDWCMANLTNEPGLQPVLSLILGDWETWGTKASALLAQALTPETD